jgi:alkylated DNA repair dioxygenase AlkB
MQTLLSQFGVECWYIENFLSPVESKDYLQELLRVYPFKQETSIVYGKEFLQPRLTGLMGDQGKTYFYSGHKRVANEWIPIMTDLRDRVYNKVRELKPQHPPITAVLGNRYNTGANYIALHSDDERDSVPQSCICSLSLGAERDFDIYDKQTGEKVLRIKLASGSLLIMGNNFQKKFKHTVPKRLTVKDVRLNFTFRSIINY